MSKLMKISGIFVLCVLCLLVGIIIGATYKLDTTTLNAIANIALIVIFPIAIIVPMIEVSKAANA